MIKQLKAMPQDSDITLVNGYTYGCYNTIRSIKKQKNSNLYTDIRFTI